MCKRAVLAAVAVLLLAGPVTAETVTSTLTFDGLTCNGGANCVAGLVVGSIDGVGDVTGSIPVFGFNPDQDSMGMINHAMIFDSNAPTCGDPDLGSPNETCAISGPGIGAGGEVGEPFENCPAPDFLNNLLIISEDLTACNPDDADVEGAYLTFDFTGLTFPFVPDVVQVLSVDVMDVDDQGERAEFRLFNGVDLTPCDVVPVPNLGDNGLTTVVSAGNTCDTVAMMEVDLFGSGAIDNVLFAMSRDENGDGEGCTPGYWKNHAGLEKKNGKFQRDAWTPTGFDPDDWLDDVFAAAGTYFGDDMVTLHDGLKLQGGSGPEGAAEILMRAAVAALLNAAHPDVSYSRTTAQVIGETNAALASGDRDTMLILAADFDFENNLGAPLCD
jgi:hypothetical protein